MSATSDKYTVLEEFILEALKLQVTEEITPRLISDLLGVDVVFIESTINNLTDETGYSSVTICEVE